MKKLFYIILALTISACATQQQSSPSGDGDGDGDGNNDGSYGNSDLVSSSGYTLRDGDLYDRQGNLIPRIFYFALDSYQVSASNALSLAAHAKFIKAEPQVAVKVEGHGDERGSREYNLALGERRAYKVANVLRQNGVADSKITSYGEERPASAGSNETAWGKNRRVEIIY